MTFLLSLPCPTKVKVNQLQGGIDLFLLFICAGNPFIICPELVKGIGGLFPRWK